MRKAFAAAIVFTFATGLACAQMKVTQQTPDGKTNQTMVPQPAAQQPLDSAKRVARDEAIKLVKQGKAVWVDVRSKEQYDLGHIKGAISIPESQLIGRLKEIPPNKMIITYCA